jgi:hypothetical protein
MPVVLASTPELSGIAAIAVLLVGALVVMLLLGALGMLTLYALDRFLR